MVLTGGSMTSLALLPAAASGSPSAHPSPTRDHGQSTVDPARAARNRANAQRSTCPRAPEAKSQPAPTARPPGRSAAPPPAARPGPDPTTQLEYPTALHELREERRPPTPTQHALVDELAL